MRTDVLIVGAGPAGLTLSMALSRHGIANHVIEKRTNLHSAPQAHVVSARTMEIFRALGIEEGALRALSPPLEDIGAVRWSLSLAGPDIGEIQLATPDRIFKILTSGPTPGASISQHKLEPLLFHQARACGAEVAFEREWLSLEQADDTIRSTIREPDGSLSVVESRYLVGCDGANSMVRRAIGIQPAGERVQAFLNIRLKGNFRALVEGRTAILYWIMDPEAVGTFIAHDIDETWVFMFPYDPEEGTPDEHRVRAMMRVAVGSEQDYEIVSIDPWMMTAEVAEHYRAGDVFLVGDAAHRFPPTGGMGLNTGVADAFNIAWKLAAVLRGQAGEALLATYEQERKPVAEAICAASLQNFLKMGTVAAAIGQPGNSSPGAVREHIRGILEDTGRSALLQSAIDSQAEHFDMTGLDVGQIYECGALLPDGTPVTPPANPVSDYVASGRPGARLPHIWLTHDTERLSTLDLVKNSALTLFCGPDGGGWSDAAATLGIPAIRAGAAPLDSPELAGWMAQCGIEPSGALLVRPDQHVACRFASEEVDAAGALRAVVAKIMQRAA